MTPVILAGGFSKRVPFKLFLSQRGTFEPVLMSSVRIAKEVFRTPAVIVVSRENLRMVTSLLVATGNTDLISHLQIDEHQGVVKAIDLVRKKDDVCVFCGDNIYGETIRMTTSILMTTLGDEKAATNRITARAFCIQDAIGISEELDGYNLTHQQWVRRGDPLSYRLISPWFLPQGVYQQDGFITELLQVYGAQPVLVHDPEWTDLGTVESVREYYRRA